MKIPRPLIVAAALIAVGALVWFVWPRGASHTLSGYVEGDLLYLSAPVSGSVTALPVEKGQRVAAGAPLFQIDPRPLAAEKAQAAAGLAAAQAQATDAAKGQRPAELAVIVAQRAEASARLDQARRDYERVKTLAAQGWDSKAQLDQARAAFGSVQAQVTEQNRRLDVAQLAQRGDQIAAARDRAVQAGGVLSEADARLAQLSPVAPKEARVQDVFFQRGEWAPANQPVVALLTDDRVKVRFYVPEKQVAFYRPGGVIHFSCDGCAKGMTAKIAFVSPTAEFTPPVIYSRESREKLVFQVEALPDRPRDLTPGIPVDVEPLTSGKP